MLQKNIAGHRCEGCGCAVELFPHAGEHQSQVVMADGGGDGFPTAVCLLEELALGELQAVDEIIELLLALADEFHHAGERAVLRKLGQRLPAHQQAVAHGAA